MRYWLVILIYWLSPMRLTSCVTQISWGATCISIHSLGGATERRKEGHARWPFPSRHAIWRSNMKIRFLDQKCWIILVSLVLFTQMPFAIYVWSFKMLCGMYSPMESFAIHFAPCPQTFQLWPQESRPFLWTSSTNRFCWKVLQRLHDKASWEPSSC